MKILVTGGAGFIGRWLLRQLPPSVEVVVVDVLEEQVHGPNPVFPAEVLARAQCIQADVRDLDRWTNAAVGADVVVHLASQTGTGQSMYQQSRYIEHNVVGTERLCEGLSALSELPRTVVLASSRAVYGEGAYSDGRHPVFPGPRDAQALAAGRWDPLGSASTPLRPIPTPEHAPLQPSSVYGATKVRQEHLVEAFTRSHRIRHVTFRLQNVYGPFQQLGNPYTGIIGVFANGTLREGQVEVFEDGEMTRDFVFVKDVAGAIVTALAEEHAESHTINIGTGRAVSLRQTVQLIAAALGRHVEVQCSGRYRVGDVRHASADMSAYERVFGPWRPVALPEGLSEYLTWFAAQPAPSSSLKTDSFEEMKHHGVLRGLS